MKLLFLSVVFGVMMPLSAIAADDSFVKEYKVKAAFLYNFLKFTEWPHDFKKNGHSNITICIAGKDPFGSTLTPIKKKSVKGLPIKINYDISDKDLSSCEVVFFGYSEKSRYEGWLKQIDGSPILTVSEIGGFVRNGGMIELAKMGSKISFLINPDTASASKLKLSSNLLELATIVN